MKAIDLKKKLFSVPDDCEVVFHLDSTFDVRGEGGLIIEEDVTIDDDLAFVNIEHDTVDNVFAINLDW